ncbi:MAG TPA: cytochrome c maturation protein CcmE [Pseudomonadales bacterium]|nr:cytochrome c maturation protein CcmE [Pseudomonadales bacterium]HNN87448.1 cytochrome c maturation protein CcmE [Pseudomonadales bacterium]
MHPLRKKRLLILLAILIASSIAVGLITFALRENMNLFFTPADIASGKAPVERTIRLGGFVDKGSVKRDANSLAVQFAIGDGQHSIPVIYTGILPDLFAEEQAAITKGQWDGKIFTATEVLAKHDENYTPPEIRDSMKKMGPKPTVHPQ